MNWLGQPEAPLRWEPKSYAVPSRGDVNEGDLDQQADLKQGWAECGPDRDGSWSWTILDYNADESDVVEIDGGFGSSEEAVKRAVLQWALGHNRR